jgi:protocatechuate 3,4-dioxygenase beta subunit
VGATKDFSPRVVAGKEGLALGWCHFIRVSELTRTIRLGKPSLFKGTIVDEAGRPVPGATVRICLKNRMMAEYAEIAPLVPESWCITRTDVEGQFVFNNVPKGATADFEVTAPGRASIWTFFDCDPGLDVGEQFLAGRTDIRIKLPLEARLSGAAVEESIGRALAGVPILARPYSRAGWHDHHCPDPVQTDAAGRFELAGLAPDTYQLEAVSDQAGSASLTVTLEAGQTMRDVKMPLSKGIPFEVAVYDIEDEDPVEDADVTVTQKPAESRYVTFSRKVTTDANGLARLRVPPGECEVKVYKSGYGGIFGPQRVQLDPGKMLRHEISLLRTACILSGEVVDGQGQVLSGATVVYQEWGQVRTLTNAKGQFDTSHIGFHIASGRLPSRVRVLARHVPSGLGAIDVLKDPGRSGRLHGRIVLKPAYVLTGRVAEPSGRGIPAACVKLMLAGPPGGPHSRLVTEVTTDANGVYCIRSVPPQSEDLKDAYVVAACAEGFGITTVGKIPFHDDVATPVRLDPIVLQPADQIISGAVEDSNDQPVAKALVRVYGPRLSSRYGPPLRVKTLTDAQGRFRVAGLCEEPLEIYARSPSKQQQTGTAWAYGGNENVRVVLGEKHQFAASLIGKPLPELKDLRTEPASVDADDKVILVCFFDMDQRPSRNCLRQLSEMTHELKAKDVVVVAVQASGIDKKALSEWAANNNILFPVGMVEGDAEKIRFTWGVESLPWLILTNDKHSVVAEGFNLKELDNKIE